MQNGDRRRIGRHHFADEQREEGPRVRMLDFVGKPLRGCQVVEIFRAWALPRRVRPHLRDQFLEPIEQIAERDRAQRGHPGRSRRPLIRHQECAIPFHRRGGQAKSVLPQQCEEFGVLHAQIGSTPIGDDTRGHRDAVHPAAYPITRLKHCDLRTRRRQVDSGGQSGQAGTDDDNAHASPLS